MKTAICAIIKDEHRFLEEWLEWHLGLGFDAIHLFEDKGSKSHEEICEKYSNVYLRRYEDDEEVKGLLEAQGCSIRQKVLYDYFAINSKGVYDWVGFFDLDEFVLFAEGYDLDELCKEFEPYPAVLLNWRMMGASGHVNRPSCGVMEAYTEEGSFSNQDWKWGYKSFVNIARYNGLRDLHCAFGCVNTHHEGDERGYYYDKAWLNHYFTKSWEDWLDRIYHRGGTQNGHRTLVEFFEANPSMGYVKDALLAAVNDKIPQGTHWVDRNHGLIAGGNVAKIMALNGTPRIPITGYHSKTMDEALNTAIVKATHFGLNKGSIDKNKLVHFSWFGGSPMPKLIAKCVESWKRYMPEYTYCLWTEDSFDVHSHPFTEGAYRDKVWAFISDYVRLWVVYHFGGIYFDTDVELLSSICNFPKNWMALERETDHVAFGLGFGAEKNNLIIGNHLREYDDLVWNKAWKDELASPGLTDSYMRGLGFRANLESIDVWEGFTIYPAEYMCPKSFLTKDVKMTDKTRAIHHYTDTWH